MALTFVSSSPSDGSIDNFINISITVTFNEALLSSSVHSGTVSIIDINSGVAVDTNVSLNSVDSSKIVILPRTALKENTNYRIILVGVDQGIGSYLIASNGDQLSTTLFINFSTGNSVYKIDSTVEKDSSDLTLEGDLFLPTNLKAIGYNFTIESVRPKNNSWNVSQSLTGDNTVKFLFSSQLLTGQSNYSEWADVNVYSILNTDAYLASGTDFGGDYASIPNYSVSVTGSYLCVNFSGMLPKNTCINIKLNNIISALDGTEYNGEMDYTIVTQLYPSVYGVDYIKREITPLAASYKDDYIACLLFKNTMLIWEKMGRAFPLSSVPYSAKQYILASTVLDLLEDSDLAKWVKAGVRRRLGDFEISINNIQGSIAMKVAKYQKMKDIAYETLNKGWSFKAGSSSLAYEEAVADISRLWYNVNGRYTENAYKFYQGEETSSNVTLNRWAKTNNPYWW